MKVKYEKGGKVTKKMVESEAADMADGLANMANELELKGQGKGKGFPLTAAKRNKLLKQAAEARKRSGKVKPSYNEVGLSIPDGPAPFEDDGMYKKGGMIGKRKNLDVNKDGKIDARDFAMLKFMKKKKKKK